MSYTSVTVILSIIYGFPSVILYLLTIFLVLKKRKQFDSSFFSLYIYDGFMNIFTYSVGFFGLRLPSVTCYNCFLAPFYRNIGKYISLNFMQAMIYHMAYVQYLITTLVSLNRLTSLLKPHFFERIWKKYTWILMLFSYFAPFLNTKIVFYYESKVEYLPDVDQYMLICPELPVLDIYSILIPFMALTMSITIIFNLACLIFLRGLNIQRKQAETKFLMITFITCAFQFIGTLITVPLAFFTESALLLQVSSIVPFTSDGLTLIQPWLLIGFSSAMRNEVKLLFGWNSKGVIQIQSLWKKYTLPLIIFIYLIPFLNTTVVFRYESDMSYFNDTDQYMLFSPKMPVIEVFSILIPFMVLTMTVTIIFNIGSWIILRSLNIQRKEAEKKFLLITFITCIFQLIGTLITVPLTTLKISPLLLNLSLLVPFTSDGLSLIQPWLLMCFSSAMRREVESVFGLKSTSRNMNNVIKIQSVTG